MQDAIGNNNRDMTEMNRSAVVKILQRVEICSRADLARQTGLSQAAITKIVAVLMEMGIVVEVGNIIGESNRRSIGLGLNAGRHKVIGVKFARNMFAVGVFDISGKIYAKAEETYSPDDHKRAVLTVMKDKIREALKSHEHVVAIGLALPGPYLRDEGRIAVMTQIPTWQSINFIEEFKDEFDLPLFIEHDANAGAMAEWWFGDHERPPHTLAYFLVGDGVGSGVIERGNLLIGFQGAASEIGHISVDVHGPRCECGNYGCLELFCSAPAMLELAKKHVPECMPRGAVRNADFCDSIFEAARTGNRKAYRVVREVAEYIGYGCVTMINAYNPDVIVIGDILSRGGDLLLPTVREVVNRRIIPELNTKTQITISKLKVDPTLYGAAAIATDKVLQMPSAFSTPVDS